MREDETWEGAMKNMRGNERLFQLSRLQANAQSLEISWRQKKE